MTTRGSKATRRVVEAAAAFVATTDDQPALWFRSPEQIDAWQELREALAELQRLVRSTVR